MQVYRITQASFADDLTGNGARLYGGRWNSEGVFALYTSQSRSLALLENIVHVPVSLLREKTYMIITLNIPDNASMAEIDINQLSKDWDSFNALPDTRTIGDRFFHAAKSLILKVPSVLMPEEYNFVLNPLMPAMKEVEIINKRKLAFNDRLLQDF